MRNEVNLLMREGKKIYLKEFLLMKFVKILHQR